MCPAGITPLRSVLSAKRACSIETPTEILNAAPLARTGVQEDGAMKLGWIAALSVMMASTAVFAAQLPDEQLVKDPDGGATLAVLTLCNDCQSGEGKACYTGAEQGWLDGKPCGKCLIESNFSVLVKYPYDVHISGTLTDPAGAPVKDRFVQVFLPGGWTVKGRTSERGTFRLMLGATPGGSIDYGARVIAPSSSRVHVQGFADGSQLLHHGLASRAVG